MRDVTKVGCLVTTLAVAARASLAHLQPLLLSAPQHLVDVLTRVRHRADPIAPSSAVDGVEPTQAVFAHNKADRVVASHDYLVVVRNGRWRCLFHRCRSTPEQSLHMAMTPTCSLNQPLIREAPLHIAVLSFVG